MEFDHIVVRYDEIATKSGKVRSDMQNVLRQRVENRLQYGEIDFSKVREAPGRIIVEGTVEKAANSLENLPGVSSVSPAKVTSPEIDEIKEEALKIDFGDSFGVDCNRSGDHSFDSMEVNRKVGEAVEKDKDVYVDLEDPDTWINVDIRDQEAFVFTDKISGPGGMPVGTSRELGALISGGIDSPVASYEMMTRGSDIHPIYFYNRPFTAEDHMLRFRSSIKNLEKFYPSKKWKYTVIDMEEINRELMSIGSGRMILHRYMMFRIADEIAKQKDLEGIVTGESLSQKSSQTASNIKLTSKATDLPIHRPLISRSKEKITQEAREIGSFEDAKIDSACRDISPENPAAEVSEHEFNRLKSKINVEELVRKAVKQAETKLLH